MNNFNSNNEQYQLGKSFTNIDNLNTPEDKSIVDQNHEFEQKLIQIWILKYLTKENKRYHYLAYYVLFAIQQDKQSKNRITVKLIFDNPVIELTETKITEFLHWSDQS